MTRSTALSFAFLTTGVALCGIWLYGTEKTAAASSQSPSTQVSQNRKSSVAVGPVARIEIPAARVATAVFEGIDDKTLARAAGHFPGTALPGGLGNFAVAGHRDSVFRNLRDVKPGMYVVASSAAGTYRYRVSSVRVVSPEEVSVLDIPNKPCLTLITCYPFHYVGSAPMRYCVRAELVGLN